MKLYKEKKDEAGGFTLTEVLITLAILAIIAAIAYPTYTGYMTNAKRSEAKTNLQSLRLLIEQYNAENSKYSPASTTYTYTENASGVVQTETIRTNYLTGFKPKAAATANAVLYDYTIVTALAATPPTYTITASPAAIARSSPAPAGNLTINQDGAKTGPW